VIGGVSALDEDTLQFYRSHAQAYAERAIAKHTRLTRFLALLPQGAKILELGCGAGAASAEMMAKGFDVEPTDGSPEMAAEGIEPSWPSGPDVAVSSHRQGWNL
jgi:cyclopropane fatty-acyl-phospholipid synthase-like methyltransferase